MIYGVDKIALQLKEIINISLNYGDVFIKNQLTPIKVKLRIYFVGGCNSWTIWSR